MKDVQSHAPDLLRNPFWHALRTEHAGISIAATRARRYPPGYIPFAGLAAWDPAAIDDLRGLLAPRESIFLTCEESLPGLPGVAFVEELPCLQMVYAPGVRNAPLETPREPQITLLGPADVPSMLALKQLAFPGYYGPRAPSLGTYYGVRMDGELVAMAGERLALPGMREVSAVCTHPAHVGRGYAARLVTRIVHEQLAAGLLPFLHVISANQRAISLYERLGFARSRTLIFRRLQQD